MTGEKHGHLNSQSELSRANGKFWGKFMLMIDPGLVQKKTLDEYLGPWTFKGVEQVPGGSPWMSADILQQ